MQRTLGGFGHWEVAQQENLVLLLGHLSAHVGSEGETWRVGAHPSKPDLQRSPGQAAAEREAAWMG